MMSDRFGDLDRRTVLKAAGGTLLTAGLAGCSGDGGDGGDSGDGGGDMPSFDGYLDNTSNYDGVVDNTGQSEVTVDVGAEGNGGAFAFEPAAIRISTGTTVVWEWTGQGSLHNVVHEGGDFESELYSESGPHFEHDFSSTGTFKYYCGPHKSRGMKGVIVVE